MSSGKYHQQHARRGRSRTARPLPILPPFPESRDEKAKVASTNTKNVQWEKYILGAADKERAEEESRHDKVSTRRIHDDEMLRSTIASWKESKSRQVESSSLGSDDQLPGINATLSDEQPFFERKRRTVRFSVSNNADRSSRDQYQLSRLQARVHQRKVGPRNDVEKSKLNLKHLKASRIKVVRGLYHSSKQELDADESITDVSSVQDVTTLSSYRGKCFDKMMYLLNDVAPLEETDVPCSVNDEGTSLSSTAEGKVSVAELKLIKKTVQTKKQEGARVDTGNQSVMFPEEIDQPDANTIASKFSDVTSPTLQDGFELDEVPHFQLHTAPKNNVSTAASNPQSEHLPSLTEVNESSSEGLAGSSEIVNSTGSSNNTNDLNIKEASRILDSTSSSCVMTVEDKGSSNEEDELDMLKKDAHCMIEEITTMLREREEEMEAKAKEIEQRRTADKNQEDGVSTIETKPAAKNVTFFVPPKTEAIPQTHCCIIM